MKHLVIFCALLFALPALPETPLPSDSLYHLGGHWTDQDGHDTPLNTLRGQPVVLAMAYTRCKEMCPLTVQSMQRIEADWFRRSSMPVRFAFFSFDWVSDTPARLKDYAVNHRIELEHWGFYQGREPAVRELAAALGISFLRDEAGEISHSYAITLLDADGVLIYQQTGLQPDGSDILAKLATVSSSGK